MRAENGTRSRVFLRKRLACEALAQGLSNQQIAEQAEISERTLETWLAEPEFRAALDEARIRTLHRVRGRLGALGIKALVAIEETLNDRSNPALRLRAAMSVLQNIVAICTADLSNPIDDNVRPALTIVREHAPPEITDDAAAV